MLRRHLKNDPGLKKRRSKLRKNQTDAERLIWSKLRSKRLNGVKFFRQYSIGPYILDFYSPKERLAIEIDGGQHNTEEVIRYDKQRENFLKEKKVQVIRFWNNDVLNNIDGVLEVVYEEVSNPS